MILGSGIIRSRGMLGSGMLRGGIIVPPDTVDPLAGLDFAFRGYGLPVGAFTDTAATTPASATDPAAAWKDENGVAFIQATAGARPTTESASFEFDGADSLARASNIELEGDFSIFARLYTAGDGVILGSNEATGAVNHQLLRLNGDDQISSYDGTNYVTSSSAVSTRATPINISVIRVGSTITFYEGVTSKGTGTSVGALSAGAIGCVIIDGTPSLYIAGHLFALLIATSDMTANLTQINDALNAL